VCQGFEAHVPVEAYHRHWTIGGQLPNGGDGVRINPSSGLALEVQPPFSLFGFGT
jgi:hypothetical protein